MTQIVIIDSDMGASAQVVHTLSTEGYQVTHVPSINSAMFTLQRMRPALVILGHLSAPDDLVSSCKQLRSDSATASLTILSLSRANNAAEIAALLDAGSDDHLRIPFISGELSARVRALLRRSKRRSRSAMTLIADGLMVEVGDRRISVTPTEFDLLQMLSQANGEYITPEELLQKVWKYQPNAGDTALVRNHIRNLRMKLEADPDHPRFLLAHHGRGYALAIDPSAQVGNFSSGASV